MGWGMAPVVEHLPNKFPGNKNMICLSYLWRNMIGNTKLFKAEYLPIIFQCLLNYIDLPSFLQHCWRSDMNSWSFFCHLVIRSSINWPFLSSFPCRRSVTYSRISSALSIDKTYLGRKRYKWNKDSSPYVFQ
jgi:hypothetical protein